MQENSDAEKSLFMPVLPALEQFAGQHRLNLCYTITDQRFGEGTFRLFWLNAHGCSCYLSVFYRQPDSFLFQVVCWGIHSKLGEKAWELVPMNCIASVVPPILQEAFHWSDAFKQQA